MILRTYFEPFYHVGMVFAHTGIIIMQKIDIMLFPQVRARLEDLITSLQAVKINLEDQLNQEV